MKNIINSVKNWFPLAVTITLLSGITYVAVYQNFRVSLDDPQIEMTEDAAISLRNGAPFTNLVTGTKVEMRDSLAPFLMVFNEEKRVVISGATLDDKDPVVPTGVFDTARKDGEKRFTWEPTEGVRIASVLKYYERENIKGYVLSGRSMREVEKRIDSLKKVIFFGWLATLGLSYLAVYKYWR